MFTGTDTGVEYHLLALACALLFSAVPFMEERDGKLRLVRMGLVLALAYFCGALMAIVFALTDYVY